MSTRTHKYHNPDYIHHNKSTALGATVREVVFGMEDGMVSTLGSITGIAAATQHPFTILLAGFVIVSVESISMAVGSYISSKSARSVDERMLAEEREELTLFPAEEEQELVGMYVQDGWTKPLAKKMAQEAAQNHELFLKEMAYRELKVFPDAGDHANPLKNGLYMGVSYVIGGAIPLAPYLFAPIAIAIPVSIGITFLALFALGAAVTKFSKRPWIAAGLEMLALAGVAAAVGYVVGQFADALLLR